MIIILLMVINSCRILFHNQQLARIKHLCRGLLVLWDKGEKLEFHILELCMCLLYWPRPWAWPSSQVFNVEKAGEPGDEAIHLLQHSQFNLV